MARNRRTHLFIAWCIISFLWLAGARAEDSEAIGGTPQDLNPAQINEILKKKFRKQDGTQFRIVLLSPGPTEDLGSAQTISIGIEKALARLDGLTLRRTDHSIGKLTLDQLKRSASKAHGDIMLAPSLKPNRWSVLLYDRRKPFEVIMHSESLSESFIKNPTEVAKANTVRNLVTQLFELYAKGESFDLPQEDTKPILQNDIPRWMASAGLMRSINSEISSRFYVSASIGGVSSSGFEGRGTNSGMLALQLGYRPFKGLFSNLFAEVAGQFFTYNAATASIKYLILNKTTTARFYLGLGAAWVTARKTMALEAGGNGLGTFSLFAVPSVSMVVPVGDVLMKLEAQYFTSVDERSNRIYSFMPGLFIPF